MFFDPMYLLFAAPGLLLSLWASSRVRSEFGRYSQVGTLGGWTGAEAARRLLDDAGLHSVAVVETEGYLSDHYDPVHRQLALSRDVYYGHSVASVGVATHEAGHALQHAAGLCAAVVQVRVGSFGKHWDVRGLCGYGGGIVSASICGDPGSGIIFDGAVIPSGDNARRV